MLALTLAIAACLPVEGDRILMRDVAAAIPAFSDLDAGESIGFAPAPGARRRFSAGELDRLAARKGIVLQSEPVCFERKLETLTRDRVLQTLLESLPKAAQMELVGFSEAEVPKGTLEFPPAGLPPGRPGAPRETTIWRGRLRYSGAQSQPVWAKVRVWMAVPCAIADRDLPAGTPIQANQIRIETVDAAPFSASAPISVADFAGLAPRRAIRAGQVIPRSVLEAPAVIARGELVGIEAHYGAASLKAEVRAEGPGRIGDNVTVRNIESGKTFRARVVRKGWVAVE